MYFIHKTGLYVHSLKCSLWLEKRRRPAWNYEWALTTGAMCHSTFHRNLQNFGMFLKVFSRTAQWESQSRWSGPWMLGVFWNTLDLHRKLRLLKICQSPSSSSLSFIAPYSGLVCYAFMVISLSVFFIAEIPKTEKAFEERLILKAFLLKFVNSYAPIFYVAFFKGR